MRKCELVKPDGSWGPLGPTFIPCESTEVKRYKHPQGHTFYMCSECRASVWPDLKPTTGR